MFWKVEQVHALAGKLNPAEFEVLLRRRVGARIESLAQTNHHRKRHPSSLLRRGTLVEVDFGFIQQVANSDGSLTGSRDWLDTHLSGEMHKRRLAVVVSVGISSLLVVPVTSKCEVKHDRSRFELSPETLGKLDFYGTSGKRSWVLAGLPSSVSFERVFPPGISGRHGGRSNRTRDSSYPIRLTTSEQTKLRIALAHGIGLRDYETLHQDLSQERLKTNNLAATIEVLKLQLASLHIENGRLRLVEEVAVDWERRHPCGVLQDEVDFLRELYELDEFDVDDPRNRG